MNKINRILLVCLCLSVSSNVFATAKIGSNAPAFTLPDSNAASVSLSDFKDRIVILEWTNHDCPFVRKHYKSGNMQALQKLYTEKNIIWLSIISSAPGKQGYVSGTQANELTASRGAQPTAVLLDPDGEVGRLYGARTTPHIFVIDQAGILRYNGAIDSINSADPADIPKSENFLRSAMDSLLAGEKIAKTKTAPYGCSIKY